jgi:hypothetical protein
VSSRKLAWGARTLFLLLSRPRKRPHWLRAAAVDLEVDFGVRPIDREL